MRVDEDQGNAEGTDVGVGREREKACYLLLIHQGK